MSEVNNLFNLAMKQLSLLGQVLLDDDWHDLGWYEYYNRYGHPDHPSPFHHWQIGAFFIFIAEAFKKLIEFFNMLDIKISDFFLKINEFFNRPNNQHLLGDYYTQ
jgi:hypothetical protein